MIQDLDPEEQYEQEPVESEQDVSASEQPVLSEPTVHQEIPAAQDDSESVPEGPAWYVAANPEFVVADVFVAEDEEFGFVVPEDAVELLHFVSLGVLGVDFPACEDGFGGEVDFGEVEEQWSWHAVVR